MLNKTTNNLYSEDVVYSYLLLVVTNVVSGTAEKEKYKACDSNQYRE